MGNRCFPAPLKASEEVQRLHVLEEDHQKRIDYLEHRQNQLFQKAKDHMTKGKRLVAKDCLRQRAQLNRYITQMINQRTIVTQMAEELSQMIFNESVVRGLKQGDIVMNQLREKLNVEKLDRLLESIRENVDHSNEVAHRIEDHGNEMSEATIGPVDEADLERELASLMDASLPPPAAPHMPPVPTREPIIDDEFGMLRQDMASAPLLASM
jgi:hypothetical protein